MKYTRSINLEVSEFSDAELHGLVTMEDSFHLIYLKIIFLFDNDKIKVANIEGIMERVPHAQCRSSLHLLSSIKEVKVDKGFSRAIKEKLNKPEGCPYLTELILQLTHFAVVVNKSHQAEEAILTNNDQEKFSKIQAKMGACAGHSSNNPGKLPGWLAEKLMRKKEKNDVKEE